MQPNVFLAYLTEALNPGESITSFGIDRVTTLTGETFETGDLNDFGRGVITINPDANGDTAFVEYAEFTAVDGVDPFHLTGVTRGLSCKGNDSSADRMRFHPIGTPIVLSFGAHNILDLIEYVDDATAALVIGTATVVVGLAGETVVAGNLLYLKNDGKWWKTDADTASTVEGVQLGIAQGAGTANNPITGGVMTRGLDSNQSGLVAGTDYYASNTAGGISTSAGTTPKLVGRAKDSTHLYFDSAYGALLTDNQKTFLNAITGQVIMYGNSTPPTGFLACDGSAVSRTTYAALFAVIGTNFGVGDGSTTFNLPDARGSMFIGSGIRVRSLTFNANTDVNVGTDQITTPAASSGWLQTGQAVVLAGSSLPTGLAAGTYYVIKIDSTHIQLASTLALAQAGTPVNITVVGSGNATLTQTLTSRTIGDTGGEETHAMSMTELLAHLHVFHVGNSNDSTGAASVNRSSGSSVNTDQTGGNAAMPIMNPFTVISFMIKT